MPRASDRSQGLQRLQSRAMCWQAPVTEWRLGSLLNLLRPATPNVWGSVKVWSYQMGIHEGHVPVSTEPIVDLAAQMQELLRLREMVRQAQLSVRKSQRKVIVNVQEARPDR